VNPTGTNYHVATNGSSSNTGLSTDSPWSLAYGITKLGPGITLMLMPGVYTGPVLIYNVTGSAANPATIRSMYKWQAIIANSPNRGVELYNNIKQPSYVVLDGLCVSNSAHVGMKLMDPNCTVRNCWITHNGNNLDTGEPGIDTTDTGGGGNVFEYNLIEYNGCAANGGHGHGIYFSGTNNIVRGNVLRYNQGFGIHLYTEADGTWNNDNYIYNNLTYGHTNKYGVTLWSANGISGALPGTNYLFGNTILDGVSLSYGGVCVTNNIILPTVINLTRPIYSGSHPPIFIGADYNLGTNTITPAGAHDVITNFVGLVKQDYGLYWLKSDSLARGHALSTAYGPVDFFGNAQFLVLDIGAFQYDDTLAGDSRVLDPSPANPDYWSLP
jgi:hypothetical protein